ncbi:glycosyltransferase family 4 protein [Methylobacterium brachiatum]|uniref:glycosyltransferase family 4 protein n=1 Tax=Methylobacterium brachiatum TaxID=269660 RepID=UPI0008E540F2|nr:glycosyltransferase family 4 protein [Methylobacterium brachiatum]SFJ78031.1 Glycosyl transferases group 1 [Methylobacterium brachiatum]
MDFDEDLYLRLNPDVERAVKDGSFASGREHWDAFGAVEEERGFRPTVRQYYSLEAPESAPRRIEEAPFNPIDYLDAYADLREAFGSDLNLARQHWLSSGWIEGRVGSLSSGNRRSVCYERISKKQLGINFFAPFSSKSGLGAAARGYLKALRTTGVPIHLINYDYFDNKFHFLSSDRTTDLNYKINLIQVNAIAINEMMDRFGLQKFNDAYNIGIWAWELNVLRPDWFGAFRNLDEIWTLSRFNGTAISAISPVPVTVINPPVVIRSHHTKVRSSDAAPHFEKRPGYTFLCIFDVGSQLERKNPAAVLEAFAREFADSPDVHLIVKFHSAGHDPEGIDKLLSGAKRLQNVHLFSSLMTQQELDNLIACADCLVSPHRAEGFGLNIAEFMALGKPVIATGYSGNIDFMTEENSYLIPYNLKPIPADHGPYWKGYLWAEPDLGALSTLMRSAVSDREGTARKAEKGSQDIAERLSPHVVGRRIWDRISDLGFDQPPPPYMWNVGGNKSLSPQLPVSYRPEVNSPPAGIVFSFVLSLDPVRADIIDAMVASLSKYSQLRWELCVCARARSGPDLWDQMDSFCGVDPRIRILRGGDTSERAYNNLAAAAELATGDWVVLISEADEHLCGQVGGLVETIDRLLSSGVRPSELDPLQGDWRVRWLPFDLRRLLRARTRGSIQSCSLIINTTFFWRLRGSRNLDDPHLTITSLLERAASEADGRDNIICVSLSHTSFGSLPKRRLAAAIPARWEGGWR